MSRPTRKPSLVVGFLAGCVVTVALTAWNNHERGQDEAVRQIVEFLLTETSDGNMF